MGILDAPGLSTRTYKQLRHRDLAGREYGKIPQVMAAPPTVTTHVFNSGTPATGSAVTSAVMHYADASEWSVRGGAVGYVQWGGSFAALTPTTYTSGLTTQSPVSLNATVYSVGGTFEVVTKNGTGGSLRVLIDGKYATWPNATCYNAAVDGNATVYSFSIGTGFHDLTVELAATTVLVGVLVGPNDTIRPAHHKPRLRVAVAGASYEEATVIDSSTTTMFSWGWPQYLGQMLGVDVISCAKGGTGYLNPGPGVKMHDRLADLTGLAPDVVIWGGSLLLNDNAFGTNAAQQAQVAACLDDTAAALPGVTQIVCGPFWPRGRVTMPGSIFTLRDNAKAAAAARNLAYLETLTPPPPFGALSTTLSSATTVGAQSITVPAALVSSLSFQVHGQRVVQIGTGATAEVRSIQSQSGTGPYTYNIFDAGNALTVAHAAGEPVILVGDGPVTGSGRQGATNGVGNSDLFLGNDNTHPTMLGHLNLANYVFGRLALLLPS